MSGQYSHKQFFRRTPNQLLADYFDRKKIDIGINFNDLKENDTDALFEAFIHLPKDTQASCEADFQDVNAMACEGGILPLLMKTSSTGIN